MQTQQPRKKGGSSSTFIQSFDGEGWAAQHEAIGGPTVEVTPDGKVWAVWQDPEQRGGPNVFGYLDEDGWQVLGHVAAPVQLLVQLLVASPDDIWGIEFGFMGPDRVVRFVDGACLARHPPVGTTLRSGARGSRTASVRYPARGHRRRRKR